MRPNVAGGPASPWAALAEVPRPVQVGTVLLGLALRNAAVAAVAERQPAAGEPMKRPVEKAGRGLNGPRVCLQTRERVGPH